MGELIKIDKRKKEKGYCLASGDGVTHFIQGGNGFSSNVITLPDSYLEGLLADLEHIVTERSAQLHNKRAG